MNTARAKLAGDGVNNTAALAIAGDGPPGITAATEEWNSGPATVTITTD